ncbi:hypothetical protein A9Q81_15375 [Gammaproteobacteria bacterium 42_54_T18]|nr:hypothetical protein A9Q81_15375 [Gammaproteobacteria bacterium 42_54_T18]
MKTIRNLALLAMVSVYHMSQAFAQDELLNHVKFSSQAMSALYMQGLSEGNDKYLRDFNRFRNQSYLYLKTYYRNGGEDAEKLLQQWRSFNGKLKLEYSKEFGWEIDDKVRFEFRRYLSDVYHLVAKNIGSYNSFEQQMLLSTVQVEAVAARFFDVSSSFLGTYHLQQEDIDKLNPEKISDDFKKRMDRLAVGSDDDLFKKDLLSVKYKWQFVEDSLVGYSQNRAYFLVYATKKVIAKTLGRQPSQISSSQM